jgi:glucose dehydrogenase
MMYVHTPFPNKVYALDLANDGKIVWKYEPKQDPDVIPVMCCDTVNRGPAYADGKIFLHQADTKVVALDAKTGEVLWSVVNGDPSKGETNTATVLPVKDKVIVGISGGEFGVRGSSPPTTWTTASRNGAPTRWAPTSDMLIDPENTTHLGKPVGENSRLEHLGRRPVEDRRRHHLGLVRL